MAPPSKPAALAPADYRDRLEALTGRSLRACPHCHTGTMVVIDCIARPTVCQPVPCYIMTPDRCSSRMALKSPPDRGADARAMTTIRRLMPAPNCQNQAALTHRTLCSHASRFRTCSFLPCFVARNASMVRRERTRTHSTPIVTASEAAA